MVSNKEKFEKVKSVLYEDCSNGYITLEDRERLIAKAREDYLGEKVVTESVVPTADEIKRQYGLDRLGELSDGYHTFDELYHHRAVLFSVICNQNKENAWKSKKHSDGTMYDGMFIVGINTKEGQATYHYDIEPYWDMFDVQELENAPEFDGHTPDEAIRRIGNMVH